MRRKLCSTDTGSINLLLACSEDEYPVARQKTEKIRFPDPATSRGKDTRPGSAFQGESPRRQDRIYKSRDRKKHTLTVTAVEQQKFSKLLHIGEKEPPLCTIINYDISPEIPMDEISVNDRSKPEKPCGILAPRGKAASAIGIIGGADGPTVIVTSSASGRTACSSLYYEPEHEPDWCMVFYNKPKEDIEIELI